MAVPKTYYQSEPTDAGVWPWVAGMDDEVAVDLTPQLGVAETPTSVTATLVRLPDVTETDQVAATASLSGTPTVGGNIVKQRLIDLVASRVYRLTFFHGPAANRRAAGVIVDVSD